MKYFLLTLFYFTCITKTQAQTTTNCHGRIVVEFTKEKRPKRIYAKVDTALTTPCFDADRVKSPPLLVTHRRQRLVSKGKQIAGLAVPTLLHKATLL